MKLAVVGVGGVGGYFGGRLAQAGLDVSFIARGAHLEALRTKGLRVDSIHGDFHLPEVTATDDPAELPVMDLVVLTVKSWQLPEALAQLGPVVGDDTVLLPLLNGVEAAEVTAAEFGVDKVLGGLCGLISMVVEPGWIRHTGADPVINIGELDRRPSKRTDRIAATLGRGQGMTVEVVDDIHRELWTKFLFITSFSGVGAVTRSTIGVVRDLEPTRGLLQQCMQEVLQLAQARGVAITDQAVMSALRFIDSLPAGATASMQRDIMQGRPSELEAQTGAVVRLAAASNIPTPVNDFIYASLLPMELAARGEDPTERGAD